MRLLLIAVASQAPAEQRFDAALAGHSIPSAACFLTPLDLMAIRDP
jgi:hypothetical protein